MLDKSKQLQLMEENKIKQLENKTADEQDKNDVSEEDTQSEDVDMSTDNGERGFWSRLFKR